MSPTLLVQNTAGATLPGSHNITGQPALLGPLANNGGLTQTHALLSGSQAIGAGNNNSLFFFDQRGTAIVNGTLDYARVSGAPPQADIGAYEVQEGEIVFNAGFEGCPALPF